MTAGVRLTAAGLAVLKAVVSPRSFPRSRLPVFQRALAHGQLRGVWVGLHGAGSLPHGRGTKPLCGCLRTSEVRDASLCAGEPGYPRIPHRGPHVLPQGGLRGQNISRAACIAVVTWRWTGHSPILPVPTVAWISPVRSSVMQRRTEPNPWLNRRQLRCAVAGQRFAMVPVPWSAVRAEGAAAPADANVEARS